MDIAELLAYSVKNKASDLHLSAGLPPLIRVDGELKRLNVPAMDNTQLQELLYSTMNDFQRRDFEANLEVDFSYAVPGLARFRVNCFHQDRGVGGAFRTIPEAVWTLEDIGAPPTFKEIVNVPRGLVLVTGPTGSGKSTTLAAMIDHINETVAGHILTIEDPIEFVHNSRKCLINQREVHRDTHGFNQALRSALREDPDIILVGEMRDIETIRLALTAAETGHLVFATLHTSSAAKTIDRIIDVFPEDQQNHVRTMLSVSLRGVIAQLLIPKKDGKGRVPVNELLFSTLSLGNIIREGAIHKIVSNIEAGRGQGMQTMDDSIMQRYKEGSISAEHAYQWAFDKSRFAQLKRKNTG